MNFFKVRVELNVYQAKCIYEKKAELFGTQSKYESFFEYLFQIRTFFFSSSKSFITTLHCCWPTVFAFFKRKRLFNFFSQALAAFIKNVKIIFFQKTHFHHQELSLSKITTNLLNGTVTEGVKALGQYFF